MQVMLVKIAVAVLFAATLAGRLGTAAPTTASASASAAAAPSAPVAQSDANAIPQWLSETGLYQPGTLTVDPRNRAFSPQYPLWTDGARKSRWIRLPAGTRIDARNVDMWLFPVGTRLWKEFAFNGRKVETRLLWRSSERAWSYAAYVWNDDQTDAMLAPADGVRETAEVAPGKRHAVPTREDCKTCHENGATPVLGFTALQLSTDRDPAAPHAEPLSPGMVTLRTLVEEQLFDRPHPEFITDPPRIPGDARTRAALGYLSANCGHCHNNASTIATVRFPLRMPAYATAGDVDETIATLAARTTKWDLPSTLPGTSALIKPGAPDQSALFVRMRSRRASSQMPPLGTVVPDADAIALVSAWIEAQSHPGSR
jgi:hypothetical protein